MSDAKYREFEETLTEVLESDPPQLDAATLIAQRSRLARARAAVDTADPRYFETVRRANRLRGSI